MGLKREPPERAGAQVGPTGTQPPGKGALAPYDTLDLDQPTGTEEDEPTSSEPPSEEEIEQSGGSLRLGRYELGQPIARGATSTIFTARDTMLDRFVAAKLLRRELASLPQERQRFLREAHIMGRLEHPNILPIYGVEESWDGRPCFIMKRIEGRTLAQVLSHIAAHDTQTEWPINRLAHIFSQVCQAVAYAHARGVFHLDIKPANVLLGNYGEVLLTDWGIAQFRQESGEQQPTRSRKIRGTPPYMSPEQANGHNVDERTDVWGLGATLYAILTMRPPYSGPSSRAILEAIRRGPPPMPGEQDAGSSMHLQLRAVVERSLSLEPAARYQRADQLAQQVLAVLEGEQEQRRRALHASGYAKAAVQSHREYIRRQRALEAVEGEALRLRYRLGEATSERARRPLWALQSRAEDLQEQAEAAVAQTVVLYSRGLAHMPEDPGLREGLGRLYLKRMERAEALGLSGDVLYYRSLVEELDVQALTGLLSAPASISIRTNVEGAVLRGGQLSTVARRLQQGVLQPHGGTPLENKSLQPGSWVFELSAKGYESTRLAIHAERGTSSSYAVRLFRAGQLPEGIIHIPAGPCLLGGDPQAENGLPAFRQELDDFGMSRFPVTEKEWLAFLLDLDQGERAHHLPQTRLGRPLWRTDVQAGMDPRHVGAQGNWDGLLPITGIDYRSATAYCAWKGSGDGLRWRLPKEAEWEKAARGPDGRWFPWGNHYDPLFCSNRHLYPKLLGPGPVGRVAADRSIYGVRDLAGGVSDLCHHEPEAGQALVPVRGGNWKGTGREGARVCRRLARLSTDRSDGLGFRLLLEL